MVNQTTFRSILILSSISLFLIVIQTTVVPLFSIANIIPDLLLIWVVYIALTKGQLTATVFGFFVGLVDDMLNSGVIGLNAFIKTLIAFLAGYFYNENKKNYPVGEIQFLVLLFFASLLHNSMYLFFIVQGTEMSFFNAMFRSGIFATVYTEMFSLLPFFYNKRKLEL